MKIKYLREGYFKDINKLKSNIGKTLSGDDIRKQTAAFVLPAIDKHLKGLYRFVATDKEFLTTLNKKYSLFIDLIFNVFTQFIQFNEENIYHYSNNVINFSNLPAVGHGDTGDEKRIIYFLKSIEVKNISGNEIHIDYNIGNIVCKHVNHRWDEDKEPEPLNNNDETTLLTCAPVAVKMKSKQYLKDCLEHDLNSVIEDSDFSDIQDEDWADKDIYNLLKKFRIVVDDIKMTLNCNLTINIEYFNTRRFTGNEKTICADIPNLLNRNLIAIKNLFTEILTVEKQGGCHIYFETENNKEEII